MTCANIVLSVSYFSVKQHTEVNWKWSLQFLFFKVACAQQLIMAVGCEGWQDLIHDQSHIPLYDHFAGVNSWSLMPALGF